MRSCQDEHHLLFFKMYNHTSQTTAISSRLSLRRHQAARTLIRYRDEGALQQQFKNARLFVYLSCKRLHFKKSSLTNLEEARLALALAQTGPRRSNRMLKRFFVPRLKGYAHLSQAPKLIFPPFITRKIPLTYGRAALRSSPPPCNRKATFHVLSSNLYSQEEGQFAVNRTFPQPRIKIATPFSTIPKSSCLP